MPTDIAEPTIAELLQAFKDGARAGDRYIDREEGAVLEHFAGVGAILFSRQARRDTDLWRSVYFGSAEGEQLTTLLLDRYGFARQLETYGVGTAILRRASASAGAGTIWKGTRLGTTGAVVAAQKRYVVTSSKEVSASATEVQVDVRAEQAGPGTAIVLGATGPVTARIEDPLWDTTWRVDSLVCDDGTSFESAADARARYLDESLRSRPGFPEAIIQACRDAGAGNAVLFPSDYAGAEHDAGLNMAYVGDAGFSSDAALVRRVTIALERWRVLGDNLQVRPMASTALEIRARVHLFGPPERFNTTELRQVLRGVVRTYFARNLFGYQLEALAGAMLRAAPPVQFVDFETPSADVDVVSTLGGRLNFPATLTRYVVRDDDIILDFAGPF